MANTKTDRKPRWYVAQWLEFTHVTQADLGRATGWSKGHISDLVNGKERWNEDDIYAFANVIRCPPGALLDVNPSTEEGRRLAIVIMGALARKVAR